MDIGEKRSAVSAGLLGTAQVRESALPKVLEPLQEILKEVVGIHVLLLRSLFGGGIPRKLPLRVSLAKSTSALLRF